MLFRYSDHSIKIWLLKLTSNCRAYRLVQWSRNESEVYKFFSIHMRSNIEVWLGSH